MAAHVQEAQYDEKRYENWGRADSTATPFSLTNHRWTHYLEHRPAYPDSLFNLWLDYHKGPLVSAHEIGTGCGIGAARFLDVATAKGKLVEHMILSDPAPSNVATTKQNLNSGQYPNIKFNFHQKKAEERFLEPNSVDFVFACEALHWCDIGPTMENVVDSLRPGGTFASVFYSFMEGRSCNDERVNEEVSKFLIKQRNQMVQNEFGGKLPEAALRVAGQIDGLNFIPFPPEKWEEGAKRIYVNVPEGDVNWFRDSYGLWEDSTKEMSVSHVQKDRESLEWVRDGSWGRKACTIEWIKGTIICMVTSQSLVEDSPAWESDEWKAVEAAVEAAGGEVDITVRVSIVLARKK